MKIYSGKAERFNNTGLSHVLGNLFLKNSNILNNITAINQACKENKNTVSLYNVIFYIQTLNLLYHCHSNTYKHILTLKI